MKTSLEIWQGQEEKPKDTRQWFPQNSSPAGHLRAREALVVSTLTSGAKNPPFNLPLEIEVETPGSQAFKESLVLVAQSCPTLCNPVDYSHQAPLPMEFSKQAYWSGLSFPFPGMEPWSPAL